MLEMNPWPFCQDITLGGPCSHQATEFQHQPESNAWPLDPCQFTSWLWANWSTKWLCCEL